MKKNDSEINEIIEGFQILGEDSGGLVNPNELKEIMDIMNMSEKNPYIYNIILALCSDEETLQKGGIEASDFISLLEQNLDDTSSKTGIQNIFSVFSNSSTNRIPLSVFSQIVEYRGEFGEDGEKIKKLITKPEINGKELTFNEFHDIVKTDTPRQSMNGNIIYKKKTSSNSQKYKYNEVKNTDGIGDEINNIGINFNNNGINNNNNFKPNNLRDSSDSPEKNKEKYNYRNNDSPPNDKDDDYNNRGQQYNYRNNKQKKIYNKTNINNINNNDDEEYDNFNDIKNFDNINIDKEQKEEEMVSSKKKYRHMRKSKNKDSPKEQFEDEEENNIYYSNINKKQYTKGKADNYDNDNEDYNDINDNNDNIDNEEKSEIKSERRYHRRYRDVKSSTPDKKDEKITAKEINSGDINNKITSGHSRYRKNK